MREILWARMYNPKFNRLYRKYVTRADDVYVKQTDRSMAVVCRLNTPLIYFKALQFYLLTYVTRVASMV
jgi:hypothetical protein